MSEKQVKRKEKFRSFLTPFKNFNEWLFDNKDSEVPVKVLLYSIIAAFVIYFHKPLFQLVKTSLILTFGLVLVLILVGMVVYIALDLLVTVLIVFIGTITEPFCIKYYEVNEDIEEYYHKTIRTYIKQEQYISPVKVFYNEK